MTGLVCVHVHAYMGVHNCLSLFPNLTFLDMGRELNLQRTDPGTQSLEAMISLKVPEWDAVIC